LVTLRHICIRKGKPNARREKSEGAHDKDTNAMQASPRKADNNPDFLDLVEFLKTSEHDPRVNKVREPVRLALMKDDILASVSKPMIVTES